MHNAAQSSRSVLLSNQYGRLWQSRPVSNTELYCKITVASDKYTSCINHVELSPSGDHLVAITANGAVYAVHFGSNRYVLLDTTRSKGTAAVFAGKMPKYLFVGFEDASIVCYDVHTSTRKAALPGHRSAIKALSDRRLAEQLVSTSADSVILWDLKTLQAKRQLGHSPHGSQQAGFTPDEKQIVVLQKDGVITVMDAATLHTINRFALPPHLAHHASPAAFAVSPDSRLLVAAGRSCLLHAWDLIKGRQLHSMELPGSCNILQLAIMPDSFTAAALLDDGSVQFVDVRQGAAVYSIEAAVKGSRVCSFSMDDRGNWLAAACNDGSARMFDLAAVRQHALAPKPLKLLTPEQLLTYPVNPNENCPVAANQQQPAAAEEVTATNWAPSVGITMPKTGLRKPAAAAAASPKAGKGVAVRPSSQKSQLAFNRKELRVLLQTHGEYPAEYRLLIWDFLLRLPHNSSAYTALANRGTHSAYANLQQQLPLQSAALQQRMKRTLSALANWCPLFAECAFLPGLVFPFAKLYKTDAEGCFEMCATLLANYCQGWFETFPNSPVALIKRLQLLLAHHDAQLGQHLAQHMTVVVKQLWAVMSSLMSDVLGKQEWLKLWDHCFTCGPAFYHCALLAHLLHLKPLLLACQQPQQLAQLLATPPPADVNKLLVAAYRLHRGSPEHMVVGAAKVAPLAKGEVYPQFTEYPKGSVESLAAERQRIADAEEALIKRRELLAQLDMRSKQVQYQATTLVAERQQLDALEAQRRAALAETEQSLLSELARVDDQAKSARLAQVEAVEAAYQASLKQLRADWQRQLKTLQSEVEQKRQLLSYQLRSRQEEEQVRALEFQAQQRLQALQHDIIKAAGEAQMKDQVSAREAALEAKQRSKVAAWEVEDESRQLEAQHEQARRQQLAAEAEAAAAQEAAAHLVMAHELEAEEQLLKVEHERRMRQLAEQQSQLTAAEVQAERERLMARLQADRQAIKARAAADQAWFDRQQASRAKLLQEQRAAAEREQRQARKAASETEHRNRLLEAELALAERKRELEVMAGREEQEGERVVEQLMHERMRDQQLELELARRAQEVAGRLEYLNSMGEAQAGAEQAERSRLERKRQQLEAAHRAELQQVHARHAELMSRMQEEKERRLLELESLWRARVQQEELLKLKQAQAEFEHVKHQAELNVSVQEQAMIRDMISLGERVHDLRQSAGVEHTQAPAPAAAAAAAAAAHTSTTFATAAATAAARSKQQQEPAAAAQKQPSSLQTFSSTISAIHNPSEPVPAAAAPPATLGSTVAAALAPPSAAAAAAAAAGAASFQATRASASSLKLSNGSGRLPRVSESPQEGEEEEEQEEQDQDQDAGLTPVSSSSSSSSSAGSGGGAAAAPSQPSYNILTMPITLVGRNSAQTETPQASSQQQQQQQQSSSVPGSISVGSTVSPTATPASVNTRTRQVPEPFLVSEAAAAATAQQGSRHTGGGSAGRYPKPRSGSSSRASSSSSSSRSGSLRSAVQAASTAAAVAALLESGVAPAGAAARLSQDMLPLMAAGRRSGSPASAKSAGSSKAQQPADTQRSVLSAPPGVGSTSKPMQRAAAAKVQPLPQQQQQQQQQHGSSSLHTSFSSISSLPTTSVGSPSWQHPAAAAAAAAPASWPAAAPSSAASLQLPEGFGAAAALLQQLESFDLSTMSSPTASPLAPPAAAAAAAAARFDISQLLSQPAAPSGSLSSSPGASYGEVERMLQQLQLPSDFMPVSDSVSTGGLPLTLPMTGAQGPQQQQQQQQQQQLVGLQSPALSSSLGLSSPLGGVHQSQTWSETLRALGISASQDLTSPGSDLAGALLAPISE